MAIEPVRQKPKELMTEIERLTGKHTWIDAPEIQYLKHLRAIYEYGTDIPNERTGIACRTLIGCDMVFGPRNFPMITTRKYSVKIAIAELLGYIRGYTSAEQFRQLGTKTWDANANENAAWLANPNRKGTDDMGFVYGAVARNWPTPDPSVTLDLVQKVYHNLKYGKDDRGETITFWNPGLFEYGCLRPCLKEHTFSLVGDTLHLTSIQRSNDWPLGCCANMIQVYVLLALMAQITGHKQGVAYHKSINCHIYENQLPFVEEQLKRSPMLQPTLEINPDIKTLEDLETWVTVDDFKVVSYECHPPIKYPFAV